MEQLTIEIIPTTNNAAGYITKTFDLLSPVWAGSSLCLPLREKRESKKSMYEVTGWDAVRDVGPTSVHVARVRTEVGEEGYLIYGDTGGVRVLDQGADLTPQGDEYLPPGHGHPFLWLALDDVADLPDEVRAVIKHDVGRADI